MKLSDLYDAIFDLVESPLDAFDVHEATAKEAAAARAETKAALERTRELQKALEQSHPDVLLEKLATRLRALVGRMSLVERCESKLVADSEMPPRVEELTRAIVESQHREQNLVAQTRMVPGAMLGDGSAPMSFGSSVLPTKFIRHDATEHFRREVEAAEAELVKLKKRYSGPTVSAAGRVTDRLTELQAIISDWPQTEKCCRVGEEVWMERKKRQHLAEERDALLEERRREVLKV